MYFFLFGWVDVSFVCLLLLMLLVFSLLLSVVFVVLVRWCCWFLVWCCWCRRCRWYVGVVDVGVLASLVVLFVCLLGLHTFLFVWMGERLVCLDGCWCCRC